MKTARFVYKDKLVMIGKFDPSEPEKELKGDWDELQQEVLDQLEDSNVFTKEELNEISTDSPTDFLKCISEKDEAIGNYNRARAIYEYKSELLDAIKNRRPTVQWAGGLDALRLGAVAEEYNY